MRIIDSHAHIFPQKIETVAVQAISDFYGITMHHKGSPEELLEAGRRAGVEKYLVFSTATTPKQVVSINNFIASECSKHPEFIGAGTMHKDFEDYEQEIARIYDLGFRGVKFHPDFQKFNIDDEKLFPIFRELEKRNMFIIAHSGDYRYDYSHPRRLARVAKAFPNMACIAAHFGGWMKWKEARENLDLPNVYYDTSSTLEFLELESVRETFKAFDPSHFFFGSDFPMWDQKEALENFMKLELDEKTREDVLYNNFMNFYEARKSH